MSKGKFLVIICVIGFCVVAVIMGITLTVMYFTGNINGRSSGNFDFDDFKIDELTDEQITTINFDMTRKFGTIKSTGSSSGVKDIRFKEVDKDWVFSSSKSTIGISTESATLAKDCILTLTIDSKLNSGKMKIVVLRDDEILECVEVGSSKTLEYTVEGEHIYLVKILCENADMEITTSREFRPI